MGKRGALTSFLWKVITLCSPPVPSSSTVCPRTWQGRASPRRASGETPRGAGWEWQVPDATWASAGAGTVLRPRPGPLWLMAALPSLRLPSSLPCLCLCLLCELRESSLSWGSPFTLRPAVAGPSWPRPPGLPLFRKGSVCSRGQANWGFPQIQRGGEPPWGQASALQPLLGPSPLSLGLQAWGNEQLRPVLGAH